VCCTSAELQQSQPVMCAAHRLNCSSHSRWCVLHIGWTAAVTAGDVCCTSAELQYFLLFLVCLLVFNTNTNNGSSSSCYILCLAQLWLFWDLRCSGCDHEAYCHLGYDAVQSATSVEQFQRKRLHPLPCTLTVSFVHTEVFTFFPQLFRMPEIIL